MSLRALFTRLFSRRVTDVTREDIGRRQRMRTHHPISVACTRNALNNRERAQVFAHFETISRLAGMGEALQQARNLATKLGSQRRGRLSRHDDWLPPTAA